MGPEQTEATQATEAQESAEAVDTSYQEALAAFEAAHVDNVRDDETEEQDSPSEAQTAEAAAEPPPRQSASDAVMARAAEAAKRRQIEERERALEERTTSLESAPAMKAIETLKDRSSPRSERFAALEALGLTIPEIVDALDDDDTAERTGNKQLDIEQHPIVKALQERLDKFESEHAKARESEAERRAVGLLQDKVQAAKESEPERWKVFEAFPDYPDRAVQLAKYLHRNKGYRASSEEVLDMLAEGLQDELNKSLEAARRLGLVPAGEAPKAAPRAAQVPPSSPAIAGTSPSDGSAELDHFELAVRAFQKGLG